MNAAGGIILAVIGVLFVLAVRGARNGKGSCGCSGCSVGKCSTCSALKALSEEHPLSSEVWQCRSVLYSMGTSVKALICTQRRP